MSIPTPSAPALDALEVRPARPGDAPVLVEFNHHLALETEHKTLPRPTLEAGVRALLKDPRLGRYFVAVAGGRVIGQLMLTEEWSDWRNGRILWLQSVYVAPEARGRGVFRRLLEQVRAIARAEGAIGLRLYVERHNEKAQANYRQLGFIDGGYVVMERMDLVSGGPADPSPST